jgi:hypothetical protein
MIKEVLEKSKINKEIIGIRLYKDEDDFWLGFIEDFNEEIIQLRHFDRFGLEDGLVIQPIKDIDSIDYGSNYEKSYEYLIRKQYDLSNLRSISNFKSSENWKYEYLKEFKGKDIIISFEISGEHLIYGYISDLDDLEFTVNAIGHIGEDEGYTVYRIEDITAFKLVDRKCLLKQEFRIRK